MHNLDVVDEDLNRSKDSRAGGYFGKSSEVAWIRSLEMQASSSSCEGEKLENSRNSSPPMPFSAESINYHFEPADYPSSEVDNIYDLPPRPLAERLLSSFMNTVQPSLPIIREGLFIDQFNLLYSGKSNSPGRKWLAVLNLVFAISTKLCQLSGEDVQNHGRQYFSRAQTLNISESIVEDHEDLQQVQLEALAAFYLLASSHVNRAWKMIGTASRAGIALGLHLRATHNKLDAQALEARQKLWFSIFILENLLSVMTGRASSLGNSFTSAPPPVALKDMIPNDSSMSLIDGLSESPSLKWTINQQLGQLKVQKNSLRAMDPTNELYFFCLSDLIVISHTASSGVYNIDTYKQGSEGIRSRINFYNGIMDIWLANLPDCMNLDGLKSGPNLSINDPYRVSLSLHYHSSRIVLNRPCLTRKRTGNNDMKYHISRERRDIEMNCLQSALAMLSIFPDEPSRSWLLCAPWWTVLHFLVQATTILLINISVDCSSRRQTSRDPSTGSTNGSYSDFLGATNRKAIFVEKKKALMWLYHLGQTDASARRAFDLCNDCVRRMEWKYVDLDIDSLATDNNTPGVSKVDMPTDSTHQQHRSRIGVSDSQFSGTNDFRYDQDIDVAALPSEQEDTGNVQLVESSIDGEGTNMSNYIPKPGNPTLGELLQVLA